MGLRRGTARRAAKSPWSSAPLVAGNALDRDTDCGRLPRWMEILRQFVLRRVPAPLLRPVRRRYYLRKLRALPIASEPDLALSLRLVRAGDSVIDLGANIGLYTLHLSRRVGPEGAVLSVEPIPETFDVLVWVARQLGLSNVRLLNAAASATSGSVRMNVPRDPRGLANYYRATVLEGAASCSPCIEVEARTLDEMATQIRRPVAFVKVDVEGHEPEVSMNFEK